MTTHQAGHHPATGHHPGTGHHPAAGHQHPATGHHHPGSAEEWAAMAELIELDAEVLHEHLAELTGWVSQLMAGQPCRRILDLGSGTGPGTFALASNFAAADLIAVDQSAELLARLQSKASELGLAGRVRAVQADLDVTWPQVDAVDLVWAAKSMHHFADPDQVLTAAFAAIRPGGLMIVAEIESFPRFLPDDVGIGQPGLEARCHAAFTEQLADSLPHLGADWAIRLERAGFAVLAKRRFDIDLTVPLPPATARYAMASLRQLRPGLDGRVSADDLATLDTLLTSDGPDGIGQRGDLTVRTVRVAWAARRP